LLFQDRRRIKPFAIALAAFVSTINGCSHGPSLTKAPKAEIKSLEGLTEKAQGSVAPDRLRHEVMRFADGFASEIAQAADDFALKVGTSEAKQVALKWKLGEATAAYIDASGDNPIVNALDSVVLATVSRIIAEDSELVQTWPEPAQPLLAVQRRQETNSWALVKGVLTPDQEQDLQKLILQWRKQNPNVRFAFGVRFQEFASFQGDVAQQTRSKPNSIFSLLYLDPMAGLDPTAQAVERTRLLADRIMYYGQRAPALLSWQMELLTYQLAAQPASKQLLADAGRLSTSAEAFAKLADGFPQLVDTQRQAAIKQIFDGLANERTNLLADLAAEEKKLGGLLSETRQTLSAGSEMATSINGAIKSLDAFVRYVSPPDTNLTAVPQPPSTNDHPFNVLDFGTAATQVASMARDLNTLLTSANQSVPRITELSQNAEANARRLVDRAFWLGVVIVLMSLAGSVAAALTYRVLVRKLDGKNIQANQEPARRL
jgi:hypothetical protein